MYNFQLLKNSSAIIFITDNGGSQITNVFRVHWFHVKSQRNSFVNVNVCQTLSHYLQLTDILM